MAGRRCLVTTAQHSCPEGRQDLVLCEQAQGEAEPWRTGEEKDPARQQRNNVSRLIHSVANRQ